MTTTEKWVLGTQSNLMTTELNTLGATARVLSSVINSTGIFDNTQAAAGDGYTLCDVELVATWGTAPAAATAVQVWFLGTQDGTNYEDGGSSVVPGRAPDVIFTPRAVTTAQRILRRGIQMPFGKFMILLDNSQINVSMAASGNTLKIRPVARQGV